MRPGKGDADDRHRENDRGDEVAERKPPAGEQQPDQIADHAERPGADILHARDLIASHRPRTERQQCVNRDIERRPRPGDADDGDRHDDRGDQPAERHPGAANENPQDVQKDGNRLHGDDPLTLHDCSPNIGTRRSWR